MARKLTICSSAPKQAALSMNQIVKLEDIHISAFLPLLSFCQLLQESRFYNEKPNIGWDEVGDIGRSLFEHGQDKLRDALEELREDEFLKEVADQYQVKEATA